MSTCNFALEWSLPGMSVLVLFQFAGTGECLETFLAGVSCLNHLDSTHQLLTVIQVIRVLRRAQRELTEIVLLLGTIRRTLNYGETLGKVEVFWCQLRVFLITD